jgi:hypothetical protein
MVVSTVGLLMGQWLKIGIAVCGNNISNFKQKPWSGLYNTLGSLFIMPSSLVKYRNTRRNLGMD